MSVYIPKNYKSKLSLIETQKAIKDAKDIFERKLAENLNLLRVSAPLFVYPETGLNDNLSGVERPVSFEMKSNGRKVEIVQSLAKWKRVALKKYNIPLDQGLYTDMNAIRKDEDLDNLHSIYVDQWDWEKAVSKDKRTKEYLEETVELIIKALKETYQVLNKKYGLVNKSLEADLCFISSNELYNKYPKLSPKERENAICMEKKLVFLSQIGKTLDNGETHDLRAPDYDDWDLNGDILIWSDELNMAIELSSMGIRVDEESLLKQLKKSKAMERLELPYHQAVLNKELPYCIGGGIGQSRLCLILLNKIHIGEVQASLWDDEDLKILEKNKINIL
ncbi:MAG TPA: aspartate--ammonia ligase [Bacilli bacterium]|jgi:aspartate--ammonia ligase|nr:aspartate--ammonia ligase [Bacilli bacterium]HPA98830.1 aspartate--ammonia ligase [Bacilli bacterium]HPX82883.1 aspartate--ammonia ligase [Bacilli bacterium]HQB79654.1 aspartate--ammonia ligase [Bacilli bacterium]HQO93316.1 aspartate--ammonia ligase [Bacilli bacterium]